MADADPQSPLGGWLERWKAAESGRSFALLADTLGVDRSMLHYWRSKTIRPEPARLPLIASTLGLDADETRQLYEWAGIPTDPLFGHQPSEAA